MDTLDYNLIQPRMRQTVRWLRSMGFDTCDSGDGVTNVEAGMEDALEMPHVMMTVKKANMIYEADRLYHACLETKIHGKIEASYDPEDESAIIILYDVTDEMLA